MKKILEIKDLSVNLNGIEVLKDVNLTLDEKEYLGIIGPNGAGKTTLLKAILGLVDISIGYIKVNGKPALKNLNEIGYVPQYSNFDASYPISVNDVIKLGCLGKNLKMNEEGKQRKVKEVLTKVNLTGYEEKLISQLSGGEKQRVLIARALISDPVLLLLDEPTASADVKSGKSFYELLHELNERITIILVSHDIGAVSKYVKKIACLNKNLVYHDSKEISREMLESTYQCPVDLVAHGLPHRVLETHNHNH